MDDLGRQSKHLDASALIACIHAVAYNDIRITQNEELLRGLMEKARQDEIDYGNLAYKELEREVRRNPQIEVVISSTALAETSKRILEEENERLSSRMWKALNRIYRDLRPRYVEVNEEVLEIAMEVASKDDYLRGRFSNCLIVAQAIYDPFSTHLFTLDKCVINSKVVRDLSASRKEVDLARALTSSIWGCWGIFPYKGSLSKQVRVAVRAPSH